MEEYLEELKEKYKYDEDLIGVLKKIIPATIQHFGKNNEQIILDAISRCEIHFQREGESIKEYLLGFFPDKAIERIPTIATAFYESMPIINNGNISSKRLIYITSKVSGSLQNETTISHLVHEIGHLIKSFYNEYAIVNGKIQKRSGISTSTIRKDDKTKKYVEEEEKNVGLEEAINCYDEEKIMSLILGRKYETTTYANQLNKSINLLFKNKELIESFRQAQIWGTDEHIRILGEDDINRISTYFERVYYSFVAPYSEDIKMLIQQKREAVMEIMKFSQELMERKNKNFSMDEFRKLDKEVTADERIEGMNKLKIAIQQAHEPNIGNGEKNDDSRI